MEIRNAKYSAADGSTFDCEVNHPKYGWVPTTVKKVGDDRPDLIAQIPNLTIGEYVAPEIPPTPKKILRDSSLSNMVFTGSSGVAIQCRPQDEQNMLSAIDIMKRKSLTTYDWYAADNTWTPVTIADLENAIISGQDQGAAIWEAFRASGA